MRNFSLLAACLVFAGLLAGCADPLANRTAIGSLSPPSAAPVTRVPPARPELPESGRDGTISTLGHSALVQANRPDAAVLPDGDDVSLDFSDAEMTSVARSVLGDILRLTLTIDPRVAGKVTLQTSSPVRRSAVLPLLESAFRLNGAAILVSDGKVTVVPADAAKFSQGTVRFGTARGPGWRTQIVPLRHANAGDVKKNLEAMLPAGGSVYADPSSNALILTGSGTEIINLLEAVAAFDNDALTGKSFALRPLQVADSRTVVSDLEAIFGRPAVDGGTAIRFLPIQRLNAVLTIARDGEMLRQAGQWIDQLDQLGGGNDTQLFVYRVNSGRASHFADLLGKLYPDDFVDTVGVEHKLQGTADRPKTASAASTSPIARAGDGATQSLGGSIVPTSTAAAPPSAGISLSPLPVESTPTRGNGTRVVADTVTNTLLIYARPALIRRIEADLQKLDVMPAQVSIEATILEVSLTDQLSMGTQFFLNSGKSGFKSVPTDTGAIGAIAPGFSYLWPVNGPKLVVDALKGVTDVNVVSAPTMMVLDNETARLQVGDQVPIITSSSQSTLVSGAPLISQVEYHDTGIILAVTPRIAGGTVMLELQQEVSQVTTTTTSAIDSPTFQQRRFYSSVAVGDGESLLMGGLISNQRSRSNQGIPFLSQVPLLGALFDNRKDSTSRTELLVMITPHIVRNQGEAALAAEEIRRRIRETVTPPTAVLP